MLLQTTVILSLIHTR